MAITERSRDNVAILDVSGKLVSDARFDLNNALQKIIDSDALGVIVNLAEVPMTDSVGIGMLMVSRNSFAKKGKRIVLLNAGQSVKYQLVVSNIGEPFEQFENEDEAVASFKA